MSQKNSTSMVIPELKSFIISKIQHSQDVEFLTWLKSLLENHEEEEVLKVSPFFKEKIARARSQAFAGESEEHSEFFNSVHKWLNDE